MDDTILFEATAKRGQLLYLHHDTLVGGSRAKVPGDDEALPPVTPLPTRVEIP
jgi:hypothetical protein